MLFLALFIPPSSEIISDDQSLPCSCANNVADAYCIPHGLSQNDTDRFVVMHQNADILPQKVQFLQCRYRFLLHCMVNDSVSRTEIPDIILPTAHCYNGGVCYSHIMVQQFIFQMQDACVPRRQTFCRNCKRSLTKAR